jgi:hypothetical protein
MNARNAKLKQTYRNGTGARRPLNVGTVFETLGESTLGGRPGNWGIIEGKCPDEEGIYLVRMYNGQRGRMYGTIMQAI